MGTVTQLEVLLTPGIDALAKCQEIDELFRGGPVETDTRPKGVFQAQSLGDLAQLIGMAHYLGYACVGLVLALVATTTIMSRAGPHHRSTPCCRRSVSPARGCFNWSSARACC